jgi:RND family efflux transporter MFP subunit
MDGLRRIHRVEIPSSNWFRKMKNLLTRSMYWLFSLAALLVIVYWVKNSPLAVAAYTVAQGDLQAEIMGTGTLDARIKTTISPRIQERLAEVLVDEGDAVKSGQLLARLDNTELLQQVAVMQATLTNTKTTADRVRTDEARAQAVLQQATLARNRSAELVYVKAASQEELDKTIEALNIAQADFKRSQFATIEARDQIATTEKNLHLREKQLTFTELRSPYDGLITRRDRDSGVVVVPGTSILQLIDTREMWIDAWVDETAMAGLAVGQSARVVFRSEPMKSYPAKVVRLGHEADRETRELLVNVAVQELPKNWAIGQRAEVFIETAHHANVVKIPQSFLQWRAGKSGVMVNKQGKAYWQNVNLGLVGLSEIEITQGLTTGEQIIKPIEELKQAMEDGQAVKIK